MAFLIEKTEDGLKNPYSNFVILKNLKERRGVHHANFVILKNLKGGFYNEKINE